MAATPPELGRMREELLGLYQQWRSLTEAEGAAIRAWDWAKVEQYQTAKQELQATITTAAERLRSECVRHGLNPAQSEEQFRPVITHLIELEAHNNETLAAQRQSGQQRFAELKSVVHNLRLVQRAYAPGPDSAWQSYS